VTAAQTVRSVQNVPGIVDAHHHVWDLCVRDQDWISGDELAPVSLRQVRFRSSVGLV